MTDGWRQTDVGRQFIFVSFFCVQHSGREAARRAVLSVSADTLSVCKCTFSVSTIANNKHCLQISVFSSSDTDCVVTCQLRMTLVGFAGLTADKMVKGFKKETNQLQQRETVILH